MLESESESTNLDLLLLAGGADPGLRGALAHGALHALHLLLHLAGWPGGGADLSARGRERPKQMAEFSLDFLIHSRPSLFSSDIPGDIFAVFLQFDVTRWPELCFADDFLHLDQQCHQNYRLSKKCNYRNKYHLRLLDFLLNSDHFQPTARRKGLQRNILKPSIIYL